MWRSVVVGGGRREDEVVGWRCWLWWGGWRGVCGCVCSTCGWVLASTVCGCCLLTRTAPKVALFVDPVPPRMSSFSSLSGGLLVELCCKVIPGSPHAHLWWSTASLRPPVAFQTQNIDKSAERPFQNKLSMNVLLSRGARPRCWQFNTMSTPSLLPWFRTPNHQERLDRCKVQNLPFLVCVFLLCACMHMHFWGEFAPWVRSPFCRVFVLDQRVARRLCGSS